MLQESVWTTFFDVKYSETIGRDDWYVEKNHYCMYNLDECRIDWLSSLSYKYKCRNYGIGGNSDR